MMASGGGSFGELTAGRSIAVDPSQVPLGSLVWIRLPGADRLTVAEVEPRATLKP